MANITQNVLFSIYNIMYVIYVNKMCPSKLEIKNKKENENNKKKKCSTQTTIYIQKKISAIKINEMLRIFDLLRPFLFFFFVRSIHSTMQKDIIRFRFIYYYVV